MSTRILFADDSMTAQNMGKKILTEAGYEVVAVSNGAAAVKKIAEQKPDIIILDIYMPGYTGLEVCDKVRASVDTLKTPVLLTVGKMEPYRAEDANRVKADGVIIKPFEASDLLAVIKKLEERVVPKTMALADKTIRLERLPDFEELSPESPQPLPEMHVEAATNGTPAIVDVPDNMATSAAFSDLLGPEPVHSFDSFHAPAMELPVTPALPDEPPAPASFSPAETAVSQNGVVEVPEFTALPAESAEEWPPHPKPAHASEFEVTPVIDTELKATEEAAIEESSPAVVKGAHSSPALAEVGPAADTVAEAANAHTLSSLPSSSPAPPWPDTHPIPVYREPEPESVETAAPSAAAPTEADDASPDVAEPVNEETHGDQPKGVAAQVAETPAPAVETPAFAAESVDFDTFSARVEAQIREIETLVAAAEAHSAESAVKPQVENGFENSAVAPAEDDFEARVAAAMSIYDETAEEEIEISPAAIDDATPATSAVEVSSEQPLQPVTLHTLPPTVPPYEAAVEAPYSFEYSPGITVPEPKVVDEPVAAAVTTEPPAQGAEPRRNITGPQPPPAASSDDSDLENRREREGIPDTVIQTMHQVATPAVPAATIELPVEAEAPAEIPVAAAIASEPPGQAAHSLAETSAVIKPAVPATVAELPVDTESLVGSQAETPAATEKAIPAHTQSRVDDEKILGEIEAQLPAASVAATDPTLDTQVIASAVHRVLERLKPHLIEEIARELKNNR